MSDYWSNFNSWDNNVEILPEAEHRFRAEHTFVSEGNSKYITHGKSVYSTHGASWTYQDGDVTWYQIGNLGYKQIGVSNTLIEGWNFFTVLGMNINDTIGVGIDNYAGLRVGIHGGLALDVNVARGVRLSYGPYYEIDKTKKTNLSLEEIATASKSELTIASEVKAVINQEIRIAATSAAYVANFITTKCQSRMMECTTLYSVAAPAVTLNGPGSLTAKAGIMYFEAGNFAVIATASAIIQAKGILKLG